MRRAVLSDPERARRRRLRVRYELGKVFDDWGLQEHVAPSDHVGPGDPRSDWIDHVARSARAGQSFDTCVRSALLGDAQALRAFGGQLLQALHPQVLFRVRLLHAFAGEWWAGGVVHTVELGLRTVLCSRREGEH